MMKTLIFAGAFVLIGMNSALAAEPGFECSAVAGPSGARKTPRTIFAQGATREEARKAVIAACAAVSKDCKVVRCTAKR